MIDLFISGLLFVLYLVAGACIFYSSINLNFIYAYTAYIIFTIIFCFNVIDNLIIFLMILMRIFNYAEVPNNYLKLAVVFFFASIILLSIHLYMIWIIFCFSIHLKHGRTALVAGKINFNYDHRDQWDLIYVSSGPRLSNN
jgi:hypothetical protein